MKKNLNKNMQKGKGSKEIKKSQEEYKYRN